MRRWVCVYVPLQPGRFVTVDSSMQVRLLSRHFTRKLAERHAIMLRDVLADIFADAPLDGSYMGAIRVMAHDDFMEVLHR